MVGKLRQSPPKIDQVPEWLESFWARGSDDLAQKQENIIM